MTVSHLRCHHFLSLLVLFSCAFFHAPNAAAAAAATIQLVDKVCKQASSYPFCVQSLYCDSRTPFADLYTLAFISVGLAYSNATSTQHHISHDLMMLAKTNGSTQQQEQLQRCSRGYKRSVSAFEMAYNDLDSETFFELGGLAAKAASGAKDCQAALNSNGTGSKTVLAKRNQDLMGLCEICAVVASLFTASS